MTRSTPRAIGAAVAALLPLAAHADGAPNDERWRTLFNAYVAPALPAAAPNAPAAVVPVAAQRPAAAAPAAPAAATRDGPFRHHLAVSPAALTLSGEYAVLQVPVSVSRSEAGRTTEFNVGAATAIAALEDASRLEVYVNGTLLGTIAPRYDAPAEAKFRLEPGLLAPGFNEVTFVARNQHRVDCSIAATYELWTRIVPALTYFSGDGLDGAAPELADLPSRLARNDAPATLKVAAAAASTPAKASALVRLVDALVLNGFIARPRIVPDDAKEPGITVGTAPTLEAALGADGAIAFADVPNLVLTRDADGATTGLVLAGGPADLERALASLEERARRRTKIGTPRGLAALDAALGHRLDEAQSVTFGELGVETRRLTGRHFSLDVPALLPGDFYQADTGNMLIYLDGAYAGGFLDGTVLKVKVNGVEALTLPLGEDRPTTFTAKELRIPLGFFHAGMNRITIEADLLTASDIICTAGNAPVRAPRIAIAASSRLVVPRLARVGVAPNLAATLAEGPPASDGTTATAAYLVGDRTVALTTAVQLFAEIAANAQLAPPYEVSFRAPAEGDDGVLVGPAGAMPTFAQAMVGHLAGTELEDGPLPPALPLPDRGTPTAGGAGPAAAAAVPPPIAAGFSLPFAGEPAPDLLADPVAPSGTTAPAPPFDPLVVPEPGSPSLVARIGARIGALAAGMLATLVPDRAPAARTYEAGDVVLAQSVLSTTTTLDALIAAVLPQRPPRSLTVVAADAPTTLTDALTGATSAPVRFDPSGQYYVHGASADRAISAGADGVLYATRVPGPMNLRLVAAGWLSNNSRVYVGLVVAALVLMGFLTFRTTRAGRDRHGV